MRIGLAHGRPEGLKALRRVVQELEGCHIAWEAADGGQAVALAERDRPELILLALDLPVLDGVIALRRILAAGPGLVVAVAADLEAERAQVFQAMAAGAMEAVAAPVLTPAGDLQGGQAVAEKIALAAKLLGQPRPLSRPAEGGNGGEPPLAVVGASTGGPMALGAILAALPEDFPAGVVIVQHIDPAFAPNLAHWLAGQVRLPVDLARPGQRIKAGQILLAGGPDHLRLRPDLTLAHDPQPADWPYKPSVDVFFASAARHWPRPGVAALLTGMGRDGAQGLLALRRAGWHTIAQDEASSVVYGMPSAAKELRAAVEILPLEMIGPALAARFGNGFWQRKQP